jgi:hypothetical protein
MELQRKPGPNKQNRRKITKLLYDLKFLCKYLTNKLTEMGKMEPVITMAAVDRMFDYIVHEIVGGKLIFFWVFSKNILTFCFLCLCLHYTVRYT